MSGEKSSSTHIVNYVNKAEYFGKVSSRMTSEVPSAPSSLSSWSCPIILFTLQSSRQIIW